MPVRVRSPAEEDSIASVLREADELHEPADDRALDVYSGVITPGATGVGHRRGKCSQHAQLGCGRINERRKMRMILAPAVWQHQPHKVFDDILGSYSLD